MPVDTEYLSSLTDMEIQLNQFLITSEGLNEIGNLKLALLSQRIVAVLLIKLLSRPIGDAQIKQNLLQQTLSVGTTLLKVIENLRKLPNTQLDSGDKRSLVINDKSIKVQFLSMNAPERAAPERNRPTNHPRLVPLFPFP